MKETTGNNNLNLPRVIFGTSGLGNLYQSMPDDKKLSIVQESLIHTPGIPVFDTAGKYGAGLALEVLGKCLKQLNIKQEEVVISNKLGWYRTALTTPEPTFEKGVWKDIHHDAVQKISYKGIIECYYQGNELLGEYLPQMVSVHDPDEYLANAKNDEEYEKLYHDIMEAYKALNDLKAAGKVKYIGVGAKNWKITEKISRDVKLDWVMIANSFTIKTHPKELLDFMQLLNKKGIPIINSAVFHGGFLMSGDYYDYKLIKPDTEENKAIFKWREKFFVLCGKYNIKPAYAAIKFALGAPGVKSIALSTTSPARVKENIQIASAEIPNAFWNEMKEKELIKDYCLFVGG